MNTPPDLDALTFNADGLIPAIAQQFDSGVVLMMAWMNRASLQQTLTSGVACYWSRSRQKFWQKGESSGHIQKIHAIRTDCDRDTLLLLVDQVGMACHTGRRNCFYLEAKEAGWQEVAPVEKDPALIYGEKV